MTSVNHGATEPVGGSGQESGQSYANSFTCIPFDVTYRPPRLTPKPVVEGAQTAIVVGPAGEEIYTDEHGRVKVQFHWDREGENDENSSCWIRVSQVWAGAGWGAMHIPRIGQEVIVDSLEGDPDRPIITGRVYHGTNTPPYPLPDEKTKSTIKSDSSLGGGGFNEIRFEDKKGDEELYIQAEKDESVLVKNDQTIVVGNNRVIKVAVDHTEEIGGSMSLNVSKTKTETVVINSAETIGVAKELTIGGAYQVSVGAAHNETVGGAKMEEVGLYKAEAVGGKKSMSVAGSYTKTIGGSESVNINGDRSEDVRGKSSETIKKEYTLKAKKITVQAEDEIALAVGKATIIMKKDGEVLIKGKNLNSKASGKINIKASSDITIKGSKIKEN